MIDAVKRRHVYVQKPISVDVMEGKAMVAAARKYNRVVQVGTQRKSTPQSHRCQEKYCRCGAAGKVSMWKCVVIIICGTMTILPCRLFLIFRLRQVDVRAAASL